MRYYIIAGEASGDVHASHLMRAIKQEDAAARFRCFGGDMMAAEGAELVQHYRDLAYMGFWPVIKHLPTILRGMKHCQKDILEWQPDVLILVDYPGFNLKIARFIKQHSTIPVVYYIAPKLWAWKEHRIRDIKRDVDLLLSILPFEVPYYEEKHSYHINYVGNPTVDEVEAYQKENPKNADAFRQENHLDERSIIALLPGSRKQEVRDNLRRMLEAAEPYSKDYQLVLAAAPGLTDD
ncbi:MAG: lipid-A-disaccharide synthase, partial [Bacteroidaceae bacterium]|nr:lipid-A-disaccharide synthase [Bacteroidaceae bacterium]